MPQGFCIPYRVGPPAGWPAKLIARVSSSQIISSPVSGWTPMRVQPYLARHSVRVVRRISQARRISRGRSGLGPRC
jgi:hypothetical protein